MDLVFTRLALLDEGIPSEVLGHDFEEVWRRELRAIGTAALRRIGVTDRNAFLLDGKAAYVEKVSARLRAMDSEIGADSTAESYTRHAGRFAAWAAARGVDLEGITADDLAIYKAKRRADGGTLQGGSWNVEAAAIKKFMDAVVLGSGGAMAANPVGHPGFRWHERAASGGEEPKFITGREYRMWRDQGLQRTRYPIRNQAFAELLVSSGQRLSEGNAFQKDWLPNEEEVAQTQANSLRFLVRRHTAKGRKARWTRVSKRAFESMWQYERFLRQDLVARNGEEHSCFWLSQTGAPMSKSSWEYVCNQASAWSHVDVTPHTLRHTFAVHLLNRLISIVIKSASERRRQAKRVIKLTPDQIYQTLFGDPLRKVQKVLGHASYETTFTYLDILAGNTLYEDEAWGVFSEVLDAEADYDLGDPPVDDEADTEEEGGGE